MDIWYGTENKIDDRARPGLYNESPVHVQLHCPLHSPLEVAITLANPNDTQTATHLHHYHTHRYHHQTLRYLHSQVYCLYV